MRRQLSRMALVAVILLFPSACTTPPAALPTATSPTQTPAAPMSEGETLFRAYVDSFNQQDISAALALFADQDLSFRTADMTRVEKSAVRTLLEGGIGEGETLEVTICADKEGKTVCQALARKPPCLKAQCGLDIFHGEATIVPKNGKIQQFTILPSSSDDQAACAMNYGKYAAWAQANRADDWRKIDAGPGQSLPALEWGKLSASVCQAYLDSQQ